MSSEHLSTEHVERYSRQVLSPGELLAADDHLAACATCRQRVREVARPSAMFSSLRADLRTAARSSSDHISYELQEAYADDESDEVDREIIESHLGICPQCAADVRDLLAFKASLALPSAREIAPPSVPSLWEKLGAFWRGTALRTPLQWRLAATAAMFVLVAIVWAAWHSRTSAPTEVADSSHPPAESPQVAPTARNASPPPVPIVEPQPTPKIVIALKDGRAEVTLDEQGNLEGLAALSSSEQQAVKGAMMTGRLEAPPAPAGLKGNGGKLMGGPGQGVAFALLHPVGQIVRTDRPVLRWRPLDGATSYVVNIYDSNFNAVATSPPLSNTEWTPARGLARGGIYSWHVTAVKDGEEIKSPAPPAPEAKFKVLEQARADEITRAEKAVAGSHLTLGVLYARAGLLADAEREFQALLKANPNSPVARKLLRDAQAMRRAR